MFAEEQDKSTELVSGDDGHAHADEVGESEKADLSHAADDTQSRDDVEIPKADPESADSGVSSSEVDASAIQELSRDSTDGAGESSGAETELVASDDPAEMEEGVKRDESEIQPLELIEDTDDIDEDAPKHWYILKVQVNRENSICDALRRRVKMEGLEPYFDEILVPTEDVREFTKSGKQRVVKRKLYPGYILVHMAINDDTWFVVRETPGIGDFTGSAGKPTPMLDSEVERILAVAKPAADGEPTAKAGIKYRPGDRVRVKEGYFQNFEGEVETIDESNGRITVMINIFGRPTPVELDHWQFEDI